MATLAENVVAPSSLKASVFGRLPRWKTLGILAIVQVVVPLTVVVIAVICAVRSGTSTNALFRGLSWWSVGLDVSNSLLIGVSLVFFIRKLIGSLRFRAAFGWSGRNDVIWLFGGFALAYSIRFAVGYVQHHVFHVVFDPGAIATDLAQSPRSLEALVLSLNFTFVGPMLEEVQFRGLLLGVLATRLGWWPAATLSSLAFAALHLQPHNVAIHFAFGMGCAYVVRRTGTLWTSYGVHVLTNGIAFGSIFGGLWKH
jgi:membrane protease YdiL (CAAX protease family)